MLEINETTLIRENTVDLSSASIDQREEREPSGLNTNSLSVNGWIQIQNKDVHHTL